MSQKEVQTACHEYRGKINCENNVEAEQVKTACHEYRTKITSNVVQKELLKRKMKNYA